MAGPRLLARHLLPGRLPGIMQAVGLRRMYRTAEQVDKNQLFLTLHTFPALEPLMPIAVSRTTVGLPARKDILHRAVVFELDGRRQGSASTKDRSEVRGSGRKIQPQKGTGRARVGDARSPIRRHGGVVHGPRPRDFATDLPRRLYLLAFRTALSLRYAMSTLTVTESLSLPSGYAPDVALETILESLGWHKSRSGCGTTLFITDSSEAKCRTVFRSACEVIKLNAGPDAKPVDKVTVHDLLRHDRVVIEVDALRWFERHYADPPRRYIKFKT